MSGLNLTYRSGSSFFHRADPISKLVYVVVVSVLIVASKGFFQQLVLMAVVGTISLTMAGQPFSRYWQVAKWVLLMAITLGITVGLVVQRPDPDIVFTAWRNFSWHELTDGFAMGFQFVTLAFVSLSYVYTTHPRDLSHALSRRGISYRYSHGIVLGLVFLPILVAEAQNVTKAHRIRDFGATMSATRRRIEKLKHLAFTMVARSLRRAETLAVAMDARGFGMARTRTYFRTLPAWRPGEVFAVVTVVASAAWLYVATTLGIP